MFRNEKTNKVLITVIGFITAGMGLFLVLPEFGMENIFGLKYAKEYEVLIRHWGLLVGLGGIYTIISACKIEYRKPILSFIIIEKIFLVGIILSNISQPFIGGFIPAVFVDTISSVILIMILKNSSEK